MKKNSKDCEPCKKLRNKAAHFDRNGKGFDVLFDSDSTIDFVIELTKSLGMNPAIRQPHIIRLGFITAARSLASTLMNRRVSITRPAAPKSVKQIADELLTSSQGTLIGDKLNDIKDKEDEIIFYSYAGFIQLLLDKAAQYEKENGTKVSDAEIIQVFEDQIMSKDE